MQKKSTVMQIVRNKETLNIKCNGMIMESVDKYQYLGTLVSRETRIDPEISNRLKKANEAFYQISNILISKKKKINRNT